MSVRAAAASLSAPTSAPDRWGAEPAAAATAGFDVGAPAGLKLGARHRYMRVGVKNSHINTVTVQAVTAVVSLHF